MALVTFSGFVLSLDLNLRGTLDMMIAQVLLLAALGAGPQAAPPPAAPAAVAPPWEAARMVRQLREHVTKVSESLGRLAVLTWEGPGASNYVAVAESARKEIANIGGALDRLELDPQKLSAAIPVFIALQQVTVPLESLAGGVAQFQGPEAARAIEEATRAMVHERQALVNHVLEMVRFVEGNATVSERELTSCREQLFQRASQPVRARPPRRSPAAKP